MGDVSCETCIRRITKTHQNTGTHWQQMRVCLSTIVIWMNILHLVKSKHEPSPAVQKLKSTCKDTATCPVTFQEDDLKDRLTPLQYRVTQNRGTERAFTGEFLHKKDEGTYRCVVCGNRIFSSEHKYNSHSGWPAFSDVLDKKSVTLKDDFAHGMERVEVTCSRCGAHLGHVFDDGPLPTGMPKIEVRCADCRAHLGHVFDDGPKPTGVRYCVNSASLDFKKETTV